MAVNFPGPYEIEMTYTTDGLQHIQRLNCDVQGSVNPGDPLSGITLETKDSVGLPILTAIDEWSDLIIDRLNTGDTVDAFNFWKYTPLTFDRTFINAGAIAKAGLQAGASNESHQMTLTFRTLEGNSMKVVILETVETSQDRVPYASLGAVTKLIMDYVSGSDTWFLARDTSYPISSLNGVGGQNEAIFKIRHR